jgi:hypothetical protein
MLVLYMFTRHGVVRSALLAALASPHGGDRKEKVHEVEQGRQECFLFKHARSK